MNRQSIDSRWIDRRGRGLAIARSFATGRTIHLESKGFSASSGYYGRIDTSVQQEKQRCSMNRYVDTNCSM